MWLLLMCSILSDVRAVEFQQSRHARAVLQKDLAQLARAPTGGGRAKAIYDRCSHPFHSWQCPKNHPHASVVFPSVVNPPTVPTPDPPRRLAPKPTLPPREGGDLFPDATPSDGGFLDSLPFPGPSEPPPLPIAPPSRLTTPAPREGGELFPDASFNEDTEALPESIPLPSTTKTPPTVPPTTSKAYDKCSHPFHSWLCRAAPTPRVRTPPAPPKPTTLPPFGSALFPDASNQQPGNQMFSDDLPAPRRTTPVPPLSTTPYDKCSHPLHAWRCQKPTKTTTTEKPFESGGILDAEPVNQNSGKQFASPVNQTPTLTTPKPSWEGADPCFHAFHSWLCKPLKARPTRPTPPTTPKTTTKKAKTLAPEASFQEPDSIFFPDNSVTTSTTPLPPPPPPVTTPPPPPPTTTPPPAQGTFSDSEPDVRQEPETAPEPQPEPEPTLDEICNHPFHSFLCQKLKPRRQWSKPNERRQPTTTVPPTTQEEEPAASFLDPDSQPKSLDGAGDFSDALPAPTTTPSPKYDKCSHPFHSWLCQAAPGRSRIQTSSLNSVKFLIGTKSLPSIQNLPLESHISQGKLTNGAGAFSKSPTFSSSQSRKGSFGTGNNTGSIESSLVNIPISDFIPTVPTIPKFVPTIPTTPTESFLGDIAIKGLNSIPTVPTVPTIPAFVPTVPTVPTVPGIPINIDNFFAEESAPIPVFRLPNDLPLQFDKNPKITLNSSNHAESHTKSSFPRGYPAIFVAAPSTVHRITAIQTLPHSPEPMLPSISALPSQPPPSDVSSPNIPRPTLPPPPSTQTTSSSRLSSSTPSYNSFTMFPKAVTLTESPTVLFSSSLSSLPYNITSPTNSPPLNKGVMSASSSTTSLSNFFLSLPKYYAQQLVSFSESITESGENAAISTPPQATSSVHPSTNLPFNDDSPTTVLSSYAFADRLSETNDTSYSQEDFSSHEATSSMKTDNLPSNTSSQTDQSLTLITDLRSMNASSPANQKLSIDKVNVTKFNVFANPKTNTSVPVSTISPVLLTSSDKPDSSQITESPSTQISPDIAVLSKGINLTEPLEIEEDSPYLTSEHDSTHTHYLPDLLRTDINPSDTEIKLLVESSSETNDLPNPPISTVDVFHQTSRFRPRPVIPSQMHIKSSSFPVLFHPPPPPIPPRHQPVFIPPPLPPPPPPPRHLDLPKFNFSPLGTVNRESVTSGRAGLQHTIHREVRLPSVPSGGAISSSSGGRLVASDSSHSVVTLPLPEHQVLIDPLAWESQRIVPRKSYLIEA